MGRDRGKTCVQSGGGGRKKVFFEFLTAVKGAFLFLTKKTKKDPFSKKVRMAVKGKPYRFFFFSSSPSTFLWRAGEERA